MPVIHIYWSQQPQCRENVDRISLQRQTLVPTVRKSTYQGQLLALPHNHGCQAEVMMRGYWPNTCSRGDPTGVNPMMTWSRLYQENNTAIWQQNTIIAIRIRRNIHGSAFQALDIILLALRKITVLNYSSQARVTRTCATFKNHGG